MDLLQHEMERKRNALQEAKKKQGGSSHRRYVKTSELRRLMEQCDNDAVNDSKGSATKSQEDQVAIEQSKSEENAVTSQTERQSSGDVTGRQTKKPKLELNTSKAKISSSDPPSHLAEEKSLAQIMRELRELGQPVTLFGETTLQQRLTRLEHAAQQQAVVRLQETEANEFRLGQGHGIRNPFLEKEKDTAGQSGVDLSVSVSTVQSKSSTTTGSRSATDGQRHDNDDKPDMDDSNRNSRNETMDDEDDPHKRIYRHFKGLLKQWEADLNDRPEDFKRSLAGRNERKTVKQCKDYIRPLFVLCKRRQLEEGLLRKLDELVQFAQEGEFVKAHDAYLDVAIGRAAWPIGVTMVGIHARSGRAKIESSNVAHVMNSELQRKYLTSVKRLLTYEQSKRTDVDPSKKVLH
jgi:pre-mRNA-splicing factor 18